uniref:WXG100-like domain-containing protein n=1 Tax=Nocardia higoensis TaxID=228599 RepID=UPI001C3F1E20
MWDVARAWDTASKELLTVIATIESAKSASMNAYTGGAGAEQIGGLFDDFLVGDQSIQALSDLYKQLEDTTFGMGTELQAAKLNIIISLIWLALEIMWAWLFPPTAPAAEAAAITTTRSVLRVLEDSVQKVIEKQLLKMGFASKTAIQSAKASGIRTSRYWILDAKSIIKGPGWKLAAPSAKGVSTYVIKIGESVVTAGGINAAIQVGQIADGKRRGFNGKEFGASVMGAAVSTIPGREFARVLGRGSDKFIKPKVDAVAPWRNVTGFGAMRNAPWRAAMFTHGAVIGGATGAVSNVFSTLGAAIVTQDLSSLNSAQGWTGSIARGAMVGGVRGLSTKWTPPTSDQARFNLWVKDKTYSASGGIAKVRGLFSGPTPTANATAQAGGPNSHGNGTGGVHAGTQDTPAPAPLRQADTDAIQVRQGQVDAAEQAAQQQRDRADGAEQAAQQQRDRADGAEQAAQQQRDR